MQKPAPRKTYITPEGLKRFQEELSFLWKTRRPQVTAAVAEAAAMGDRSENAEYIYGKRQLRQIDSRIRFLTKKLESFIVVDRKPEDRSKIYFGAWVELEDGEGNLHEYRIVGPDEAGHESSRISVEAPLAKALLRKSVGDEITVQRPKGPVSFVVLSIRY